MSARWNKVFYHNFSVDKFTMTKDDVYDAYNFHHPGTSTATAWKKRYGNYLEPQKFDDVGHQWHLALDKNWGPWSCCGGAANSPPCTARNLSKSVISDKSHSNSQQSESSHAFGVGAYIHFIEDGNNALVVGDLGKYWKLESGRVAKKRTHGKVWLWLDEHGDNN